MTSDGSDMETAAFEWYVDSGLAVIMPVSGQTSFYADWYKPACGRRVAPPISGRPTQELQETLAADGDVDPTRDAAVSLFDRRLNGGMTLLHLLPATVPVARRRCQASLDLSEG